MQPAGALLHGFGDGWHEQEYEPATGRRWRWTSDRAVLLVTPPQDIRLTLRGESPLRYVDVAPRVSVMAGDRKLDIFEPADDFTRTVTIRADEIAASGGTIAIETDRVYLPSAAEGTADARRLGLRLFDIAVHPVLP